MDEEQPGLVADSPLRLAFSTTSSSFSARSHSRWRSLRHAPCREPQRERFCGS